MMACHSGQAPTEVRFCQYHMKSHPVTYPGGGGGGTSAPTGGMSNTMTPPIPIRRESTHREKDRDTIQTIKIFLTMIAHLMRMCQIVRGKLSV